MEADNGQGEAPITVKGKHRKSSLSLSALFHGHLHRRHDVTAAEPLPTPEYSSSPSPSPTSPKVNHSRWLMIRPKQHHNNDNNNNNNHHPAETTSSRGKCRNIRHRIGHHRRHASDLTYDPLSYAHNFESDKNGDDDNEYLLMNSFTARLKAGEEKATTTPPHKEGKKIRRKSFDLNDLMTVAKSLDDEPARGS